MEARDFCIYRRCSRSASPALAVCGVLPSRPWPGQRQTAAPIILQNSFLIKLKTTFIHGTRYRGFVHVTTDLQQVNNIYHPHNAFTQSPEILRRFTLSSTLSKFEMNESNPLVDRLWNKCDRPLRMPTVEIANASTLHSLPNRTAQVYPVEDCLTN